MSLDKIDFPLVQATPANGYKVHAVYDNPTSRIIDNNPVWSHPRTRNRALCGVHGRDQWAWGWMTIRVTLGMVEDAKPLQFTDHPGFCQKCVKLALRAGLITAS